MKLTKHQRIQRFKRRARIEHLVLCQRVLKRCKAKAAQEAEAERMRGSVH